MAKIALALAAASIMTGGSAMAAQHQASGSFTVSMKPETNLEDQGLTRARISVEKHFTGALQGTGSGTMLSATTPEKGSAAYVLIERIEGTLDGRTGSFALAHLGLMDKGAPQLSITIVPGSGTGALAGIRGTMALDVGGGRHDYAIDYSLPSN